MFIGVYANFTGIFLTERMGVKQVAENFNYQMECLKTWRSHNLYVSTREANMLNAALGIAGEAGEFVELVKKRIFHRKDISRDDMIDELGDVLYYCAIMADQIGMDLDEVMERNIAKLRERHGDTYNDGHYTGGGIADVPGVKYDANGKALHYDFG